MNLPVNCDWNADDGDDNNNNDNKIIIIIDNSRLEAPIPARDSGVKLSYSDAHLVHLIRLGYVTLFHKMTLTVTSSSAS
jgi:hypothetical protein